MKEQSEPTAPTRFYGPAVFSNVIARYDIGKGDRFYDSPRAYGEIWKNENPVVHASLVVTYASRGELGAVHYLIEERVPGTSAWKRGEEKITTQREFAELVTILP